MLAEPIDDSLVTGASLDLVFEIMLPGQPNNPGYTETLAVTIDEAVCDCSLLLWDNPSTPTETTVATGAFGFIVVQEAEPNADSKTTTPAIRKCYRDSPCDETFTLTLVDQDTGTLPSFLDYSNPASLIISPTVAADLGTWNLQLT